MPPQARSFSERHKVPLSFFLLGSPQVQSDFYFCSSPSSQCSEHPARSRSVFLKPASCGLPYRLCLRRSTLTRRGTPLAPLETWRVASPTPRLNTKAGFINHMSYTNDHQRETFYRWPSMSSHQARSKHNSSILLTGGRSTCTRDLFQALEFHRLPAGKDLNCPAIGCAGLVMSLL